MKDFLEYLGINVKHVGSKEITCDCPFCQKKNKLSVNKQTGQYICFSAKCGKKGNPKKMVKELLSEPDPAKIAEILGVFNITSTGDRLAQSKQQLRIPSIKLKASDIRELNSQELEDFCQLKKISVEAFKEVIHKPMHHTSRPELLLPGYNPWNMKHAWGVIRAHEKGELIVTKVHPEGCKYPQQFGSRHALVGLHHLGFGTTKRKKYDMIILTEGWGDAVTAVDEGYDAVASTGGAGTKRIRDNPSWLPVFEDKIVYIIMDADKGGQKTLKAHAQDLYNAAKRVMICQLPYEIQPKKGKDLKDYVREGNDIADLIKEAQAYVPEPEDEVAGEGMIILPDLRANTIAQAFINKHPDLHYQHKDGWTIYEDQQYRRVDEEATVLPTVGLFANKCAAKRGKSMDFFSPSTAKNKSILQQVSFLPSVNLKEYQSAPCSLDGSLNPNYIIALKNGLLDWSEYPYKFYKPSPNFYTYNYLPFEWHGEVVSQFWTDTLLGITESDIGSHDILQEWYGYTFAFREGKKKFLILKGEADTGKSIYSDILTELLGHHNVSAVPLISFKNPHLMYESYGKMLNISDENEDMLRTKAVETVLKHYTGGTMYQFKRMYCEAFSAYPTAKILISTNHLPEFSDTSEGIWTRMLYVPFNHRFIEGRDMDKHLKDKLLTTEMPGILCWALQGARRLLANKGVFTKSEKSEHAILEYRREVLPEISFFEENFKSCDPEDGTFAVSCVMFRNAYVKWCKRMGIDKKSNKKLAETMAKIFPGYIRKQKRSGEKKPYHYFGIKMSTDSEFWGDSSLMEGEEID